MKLFCLVPFMLLPLYTMCQQKQQLTDFFTAFYQAAEQKAVMEMNALIYPFKYADKEWDYRLEDVQDRMLQGALRGAVTQKGQGAFSLEALDLLIKTQLNAFTTCSTAEYKVFLKNKILSRVLAKFKKEEILLFDQQHTDTHIIILKTASGLQLLAWKNLNALLEK